MFREFSKRQNEELKQFAGRVNDFLQSFYKRAGFTVMLEPVTDFLAGTVVPDDVGCTQLGEVTADGLHRAAREFSKRAGRHWAALAQEHDKLIDHRIAEQTAQARFPIFGFVHPGRCMIKARRCQACFHVSGILETSNSRDGAAGHSELERSSCTPVRNFRIC
jgi:hypothetical protein